MTVTAEVEDVKKINGIFALMNKALLYEFSVLKKNPKW